MEKLFRVTLSLQFPLLHHFTTGGPLGKEKTARNGWLLDYLLIKSYSLSFIDIWPSGGGGSLSAASIINNFP